MTLQTIDSVRAYWDSRPCNIRRSPAPVGSSQFFEDTERNKYFVEPHIPGFAEYEKWIGKKVLEIGCGIGIDTARFVRWGADVTAIDLSQKSLDIADARVHALPWSVCSNSEFPYFHNGRAKFLQMNAEQLGFDGTLKHHIEYDLVYAFGSIHHSPNPDKIVNRVFWSLKPNGTLKLMVYNKYSFKSLWILLKYGRGQFWKFDELVARYSEAQTGCPITHVYSKKELRAMLERNGFHVKKISVDHIFPYDIEAYKRYEYKVVWYFRWIPKSWFRAFEKNFGWHLLAEATV
jgi:SAM-dependent methyltransferase